MPSSVEIIPVKGSKLTRAFLSVPDYVYRDDPHWRPQLRFERAAHLNPSKNPGAAAHGDRQLFLAKQSGEYVGRIAAFICLLYTSPSPRDATLSRMPSSA